MAKIDRYSNIIVSRRNYEISQDSRFLIPFYQGTKIGFADKEDNIIIGAQFDFVLDDFLFESSIVRVGVTYGVAFERKTKPPVVSLRKRFGLLKSNGEFLVPMDYEGISMPEYYGQCITLRSIDKGYAVIDNLGNTIVPFGKYNYIDGFQSGYARIKSGGGVNGLHDDNSLWGIIDENGNEVLAPKYKNIRRFYKVIGSYAIIEGFEDNYEFHLMDGSLKHDGAYKEEQLQYQKELDDYIYLKRCQEEETYEEYNGSYAQDVMGYSDQVINDAFDGDPDAYWNID